MLVYRRALEVRSGLIRLPDLGSRSYDATWEDWIDEARVRVPNSSAAHQGSRVSFQPFLFTSSTLGGRTINQLLDDQPLPRPFLSFIRVSLLLLIYGIDQYLR